MLYSGFGNLPRCVFRSANSFGPDLDGSFAIISAPTEFIASISSAAQITRTLSVQIEKTIDKKTRKLSFSLSSLLAVMTLAAVMSGLYQLFGFGIVPIFLLLVIFVAGFHAYNAEKALPFWQLAGSCAPMDRLLLVLSKRGPQRCRPRYQTIAC